MNLATNASICARSDDLISFLYGEASEREAQEFNQHLTQCRSCRSEVASFNALRESIGTWRQEALTGFASAGVPATTDTVRKRSAIAAIRAFLDLSPLWMRGAVAFATAIFCLLAVLALGRIATRKDQALNAGGHQGTTYTEQDLAAAVRKALDEKAAEQSGSGRNEPNVALAPEPAASKQDSHRSARGVGSRRPLSRAERAQLAADLRLTSVGDEKSFDLLVDRINY